MSANNRDPRPFVLRIDQECIERADRKACLSPLRIALLDAFPCRAVSLEDKGRTLAVYPRRAYARTRYFRLPQELPQRLDAWKKGKGFEPLEFPLEPFEFEKPFGPREFTVMLHVSDNHIQEAQAKPEDSPLAVALKEMFPHRRILIDQGESLVQVHEGPFLAQKVRIPPRALAAHAAWHRSRKASPITIRLLPYQDGGRGDPG